MITGLSIDGGAVTTSAARRRSTRQQLVEHADKIPSERIIPGEKQIRAAERVAGAPSPRLEREGDRARQAVAVIDKLLLTEKAIRDIHTPAVAVPFPVKVKILPKGNEYRGNECGAVINLHEREAAIAFGNGFINYCDDDGNVIDAAKRVKSPSAVLARNDPRRPLFVKYRALIVELRSLSSQLETMAASADVGFFDLNLTPAVDELASFDEEIPPPGHCHHGGAIERLRQLATRLDARPAAASKPGLSESDTSMPASPGDPEDAFPPMEFIDPKSGDKFGFGNQQLLWQIWKALWEARRRLEINDLEELPAWKDKSPIEPGAAKNALARLRDFWREKGRPDLADCIRGGTTFYLEPDPRTA